MEVSKRAEPKRASVLGETVPVEKSGRDLLSRDGSRRFCPYGDDEWGWWVEVTSDGEELPGLWEHEEEAGVVVCACV